MLRLNPRPRDFVVRGGTSCRYSVMRGSWHGSTFDQRVRHFRLARLSSVQSNSARIDCGERNHSRCMARPQGLSAPDFQRTIGSKRIDEAHTFQRRIGEVDCPACHAKEQPVNRSVWLKDVAGRLSRAVTYHTRRSTLRRNSACKNLHGGSEATKRASSFTETVSSRKPKMR